MTNRDAAVRDPVAVIGLGAIGTMFAAALAEAGHPVTVCGRTPVDRVEVTDGDGTRTFPVTWVADAGQATEVPWVLLATKIHQTASTADWLTATTGPRSHVVVAQNGIDHHERVQPLAPDATIVPALVYLNAERAGPGSAVVRPPADHDLVLPADEAGTATAKMCRDAGLRVTSVGDFRTAAWSKLLTNAAGNPITALTGRRVEVLREPAVAALAMDVLREAVAVGRAEGAALDDGDAVRTLTWLQALAAGSTSSMLQDREAGRPLEYEGLTGAIVRLGDHHGVPVGANRTLLALLAALS